MTKKKRSALEERVRRSIKHDGFFIYVVKGRILPTYLYTVGLVGAGLPELLLAGATYYFKDDAVRVLESIARRIFERGLRPTERVHGLGDFSVRELDLSYSAMLMDGANSYYGMESVPVAQVTPTQQHYTLDAPVGGSMRVEDDPVWRWAAVEWPHEVLGRSAVATNLQFLRGEQATEAARWGEDEFEIFAGPGPDVVEADMRVISLATAIGIDPTVRPVLDLAVAAALWREPGQDNWYEWRAATQ